MSFQALKWDQMQDQKARTVTYKCDLLKVELIYKVIQKGMTPSKMWLG